MQDYLKEFTVKDAIYLVVNAWNEVDKSTVTNAGHKTWLITMM